MVINKEKKNFSYENQMLLFLFFLLIFNVLINTLFEGYQYQGFMWNWWRHITQPWNKSRLFPVHTMVPRICFVCLPLANCSSSKCQIIVQYRFDQFVIQPKYMCRATNISMESSAVVYFQWSISRSIGPWSIKRVCHTGCFYFLLIACSRVFWRVCATVCCVCDNINLSCCPWWTVCVSSCQRQITYMAYSSHTAPLHWFETALRWLCQEDWTTTGTREEEDMLAVCFVWLMGSFTLTIWL